MKIKFLLSICAVGLLQGSEDVVVKQGLKTDQVFPIGSIHKVQGDQKSFYGAMAYQPVVEEMQDGGASMYHALYNAIAVRDYLRHEIGLYRLIDYTLTNQKNRAGMFGSQGAVWKSFVSKNEPGNQTGNCAGIATYQALINKFFPRSFDRSVIFDSQQQFLDQRNRDNNMSLKNRENFWNQLKKNINDNVIYTYYFFLNDKPVVDGCVLEDSHWITVVFHKDITGKHNYYVMDSANEYQLESPLVKNVIDGIETDNFFLSGRVVPRGVLETVLEEEDDSLPTPAAPEKDDQQVVEPAAARVFVPGKRLPFESAYAYEKRKQAYENFIAGLRTRLDTLFEQGMLIQQATEEIVAFNAQD